MYDHWCSALMVLFGLLGPLATMMSDRGNDLLPLAPRRSPRKSAGLNTPTTAFIRQSPQQISDALCVVDQPPVTS